jgi:excisionase family DNA binding protein
MKPKLKLNRPAPKTIVDLCAVTGLSRPSVTAAIQRGELLGHKVGAYYVIPAEAFDAFCRGEWVPHPRPQVITPIRPETP